MYLDIILKMKDDDFFPAFIPDRLLKKSLPYSRTGEIVDLFKNNVKAMRDEDFRPNRLDTYTDLYRFYGNDYFCFTFNPDTNTTSSFVFEKVDTNRHWTIVKSSEGSEHIHYFTDKERYELIDIETGYGTYLEERL